MTVFRTEKEKNGFWAGFAFILLMLSIYYGFNSWWPETVIVEDGWLWDRTEEMNRFHPEHLLIKALFPTLPLALLGGLSGLFLFRYLGVNTLQAGEVHSISTDDLQRLRATLALQAVSIVTFVIAICIDCMRIVPRVQSSESGRNWIYLLTWVFGGDPDPRYFSISEGILKLISSGDVIIGVTLLIFSILFPALKNLVISYTAFRKLTRSGFSGEGKAFRILSHLGKWSMLDVMVIAMMVVSFKAFPMGTRIDILAGTYLFFISVIASNLSVLLLRKSKSE